MAADISELLGKTLISIESDEYELIFICDDGNKFKMYHENDCCEYVSIDDINGDLKDLIGSPITLAEKVSNESFEKEYESQFNIKGQWGNMENKNGDSLPESYTWTFYKLATVKGYLEIRWFGESNGYYSESVDFIKANKDGEFNYWD